MKWFLEWLSTGENWVIVFILGFGAVSGIVYIIRAARGTDN